ncbi:MAG: hypothetical protein AAB678_00355 [Patescibacteria group bacterium]
MAKLLYDRAAEKNPGKQKDALLNISEALEKGTATEEQLSAGLKEVENLFELSTFSPIYSDNRGDFNAMRHFLKRELHSVRDAKRIEAVRDKINNGSEIDEKKINEKIGFAKGWLERGLGESLHGLGWPNTENDLVKHQKLANGLEEIRKAWTKDKEMDFKKAPRYKKLIKELFDSLKK